MSTKCHPKRGHFVDKSVHEMSPLLSTRCHQLCPRNVCHPFLGDVADRQFCFEIYWPSVIRKKSYISTKQNLKKTKKSANKLCWLYWAHRSINIMVGTNNRVSVAEWEAFCLLLNFIKLTPRYMYQDSKALSFYSVKAFYKALYVWYFFCICFVWLCFQRESSQTK